MSKKPFWIYAKEELWGIAILTLLLIGLLTTVRLNSSEQEAPPESCEAEERVIHLQELELARARDCQVVLSHVSQALEETASSLEKCEEQSE